MGSLDLFQNDIFDKLGRPLVEKELKLLRWIYERHNRELQLVE